MAQPLVPVQLRHLGQYGFFAEADGRYDDLRYASTLTNIVFDEKGRPASRNGWSSVLASAITNTPTVEGLHYFQREIGETDYWIAATNQDDSTFKIWKVEGAVGAATSTDITGTITSPTSYSWQFANYNNNVVGIQQGDNPIEWDGSATPFADMDSGGSGRPDGNCIIAAWGRCFATTADGQTVQWTPSLSSDWDNTGSGSLNVRLVWPNGKDHIIAIVAFAKRLIIFGKESILVYGDSTASQDAVGIDPNGEGFGLLEAISGVGLRARDAVVEAGDDLLFVSQDGIRSLRRAVDYENLPMQTLTRNIDPYLIDLLKNSSINTTDMKLVYHVDEAMVLLRMGGTYFYLDMREPVHDMGGAERGSPILRSSIWSGLSWQCAAHGRDGKLRFGFTSGVVGEYGTYLDNASTYTFDMSSVWLSLADESGRGERLKFLKRLLLFASTEKTYQVHLRWAYDFSQKFTTKTVTVTQDATPAEWGLAEWGDDEWSGGALGIFKGAASGSGSGTYIKIGFSLVINGAAFAFNALTMQTKLGRLSR